MNTTPSWLRPYLGFLAGISAIGLALSLYVHLAAIFELSTLPGPLFFVLHIGVFVVFIGAMLAVRPPDRTWARRATAVIAIRQSPRSIRFALYGLGCYAVVSLGLALVPELQKGDGNVPDVMLRAFSAVWMAAYSGALAIFFRRGATKATRKRGNARLYLPFTIRGLGHTRRLHRAAPIAV
jgi:hypothetical protein